MKIRAKHIVVGVLAFNAGLVLLTLGLSWHAETQHPMAGELIEVDDTSVHVVDSGQGDDEATSHDAIVLIHGASTSALDFQSNLMPELSKGHRVLAFDRPGHGYSERGSLPGMDSPEQQARIVLDALVAMEVENPVIVGHSWAGSVVLAALLEQHEQVEPAAGILIAGVTHPYDREDSAPTRLALRPVIGPVFRWQYLALVGRAAMPSTVERFFLPDEVPENYIDDTGLDLSLRPTTYLYNARDRSNLSANLVAQSQRYSEIDAPLLSIFASEDHVVPPADHHEKLALDQPEMETVEILGAGHLPHHTRTAEVVSAIREFVSSLE